MTESVELADPRTEPEPSGWAGFFRAQGLHAVWDYELLRLEAWAARNPPLLLVARSGGEIVAAACVLVCRLWPRSAYAPGPRHRGLSTSPLWAEVSQPWLSGLPGVVFAENVDGDARARILRRFERALARRLGLRTLGALYRSVDADIATALDGRGRMVRQVDTVSVLSNTFADRDDWVGMLSKSRRSSLRRSLREVQRHVDSGRVVIRSGSAREDLCGGAIAHLINRHRTERGTPLLETRSPLLGSYFDVFVRRSDVYTLTYHDSEGRLLAVNTWLDHPRCLVKQHWASLSVADGGLRDLLFDSFSRAVEYMISVGAKELSAGRSPHEHKHGLGFAPRPVYGVAVPRPVMGR
ncbi:peptidogalycan biosysnthesis protein [Saccharomonospora sp.]|uniref:peptidogalycan biosysnthesis protein n=1 Tax=Saccharomonospora sp. TaxID=33913 RepID=UPI00263413B8|nr:peptidogalycan biosysnthesis protein [Saccharomonospora sp.]